MNKNVLVLIKTNDAQKRLLEGKAPELNFIYTANDKVLPEQVKNANIIIGNPPVDTIKDSEKLEWLQLFSAGTGEYVIKGVLPKGTILTNATGAYGPAISEYMLGVLLELYKKLHLYRDNQFEAQWSYLGKVKAVLNSTVLIIGMGDIGGEFAKRLKALGAYTIGIKRTEAQKPDYIDELYKMDQLEDVLPRADVVSLSLPGTKLTDKIINQNTLKLMKNDAVLINVGRGNAVDTEDLCDALENGRLSGAALDVTDPEPLPKEHRLWKMKNVIITPHVAGGFSLEETRQRVVDIAAYNLEAFLQEKNLINVIDPSKGY